MKSLTLLTLILVLVVAPGEAHEKDVVTLASTPATGSSGGYYDVSLAIHLVASDEYLACSDLCPPSMSCHDVNCDLSLVELLASGGYGYIAFLCYNAEQVEKTEFFVTGWPVGPGTPDFLGPYYCVEADGGVLGEPFEKRGGEGGVVRFPCEAPCSGMFCLCYLAFGPSIIDWLPITIAYMPSRFSDPSSPCSRFQHCNEWVELPFEWQHSAVLGGECAPAPNCNSGPTGGETTSWGAIKDLYR